MKFFIQSGTLLTGALIFSQLLTAQNSQIVQLRPGPENGYHSDIRTDNPAPNWTGKNVIANAWTVGGAPFVQRSLLKFDLSEVPTGATIIRASLSLFCNTTSGHYQLQSGDNAAQLQRITQPWDQTTTNWSNQPPCTNEGAVVLPVSSSNTQDYPNIDVTDWVTYWHQNPEANHGMLLRLIEESMYRCMVFGSSNHLDESKRPLLEIEFTTCQLPLGFFRHSTNGLQAGFFYNDTTTVSWLWDFGDNTTSSRQNPVHQYEAPGRYIVNLTTVNPCGSKTIIDTITVCRNPVADFSFFNRDLVVSFKSLSREAESWYWSFGNGFFSNLENPVYDYLQPGIYRACLLVTNSCGSDISCKQVSVGQNDHNQGYTDPVFVVASPNPTTSIVTVATSTHEFIYRIDISDTTGNLLKTIDGVDINEIDLDLADMAPGIYLVGVKTANGYYTELILKQ